MQKDYSDIIIINNNKVYELNKCILSYIPYFKNMFISSMEESTSKIINVEFEDKYWEEVINNLYERKKQLDINNFSFNYLEILKFLGLYDEIDKFNKKLSKGIKNLHNKSEYEGHLCSLEYRYEIIEYILLDTNLRIDLLYSIKDYEFFITVIDDESILDNNYKDDTLIFLEKIKNYKIISYVLISLIKLSNEYDEYKWCCDYLLNQEEMNDIYKNNFKYQVYHILEVNTKYYDYDLMLLIANLEEYDENIWSYIINMEEKDDFFVKKMFEMRIELCNLEMVVDHESIFKSKYELASVLIKLFDFGHRAWKLDEIYFGKLQKLVDEVINI